MSEKIPQHIAIIMDGNGRWAESHGLERFEGHKAGVEVIRRLIRCCINKPIKVLSLFAFSSENWSRPIEEVEFLMDLFLRSLETEINELHQQGIAIRFTGSQDGLSSLLKERMSNAENLTAKNEQLVLNIVINYGGRWDIVNASKRMMQDAMAGKIAIESINEDVMSTYMAMADLPPPDLFIRTSGEFRISNFFLWQLAYTELYFTDVYWPDFSEQAFEEALQSFGSRERRYGRLSKQINEADYV